MVIFPCPQLKPSLTSNNQTLSYPIILCIAMIPFPKAALMPTIIPNFPAGPL